MTLSGELQFQFPFSTPTYVPTEHALAIRSESTITTTPEPMTLVSFKAIGAPEPFSMTMAVPDYDRRR